MARVLQETSGGAQSARETKGNELDRAVEAVKAKADEFARLTVAQRLELLRPLRKKFSDAAEAWTLAGARAQRLHPDSNEAAELMLTGPLITIRNLRLLEDSLTDIQRYGRPSIGSPKVRADGRCELEVFPASALDTAVYPGFRARLLFQQGVTPAQVRERQAPFYQQKNPPGRVSVILGAGNVASIPLTDMLHRMFAEGHVCVVKMNPVNEWVGPFFDQTLEPLISRGYVRIVYGGGDVGAYLIKHPLVDSVHITGSDKTHDLIVWGPPGPERERRKAANDPVFKKEMTSELGNVSPIVVVPGHYSDAELWFQARSVVSQVANNGSFNCVAGKMLVLSEGWPQKKAFLDLVRRGLSQVRPRYAYYPGAKERYAELLEGRKNVEYFGRPGEGELSWAFAGDLDPNDAQEKLYRLEPFCGLLGQTALAPRDPVEFLETAVTFCNEKMWGTLNALVIAHDREVADPVFARALDQAFVELRYGTVGLNHWPGLVFGIMTTPWGGHPSSKLADVQSGIGWVHNTLMLEGIDKTILTGPLVSRLKLPWFYDSPRTRAMARKLVALETSPSWLKLPGIGLDAILG